MGLFGLAGSAISAGVSATIAAKNRKFQKKMYKSRYQYTMEDMRKAGLNPMLAMQTGVGGGVPSGAMAQIPDFGATANTAKRVDNETALSKAQREGVEATTAKTVKETELLSTELPRAHSMEAFDANVVAPLLQKLQQFMDSSGKNEAKADSIIQEFNEKAEAWMKTAPSKAKAWMGLTGQKGKKKK